MSELSNLFIESEAVPEGEFRIADLSRVRITKESEIIEMKSEVEGDKLKVTVKMSSPEFLILPKREIG